MLHLGNCDVVGSAPVIIYGKNTGGGNRNAYVGYADEYLLFDYPRSLAKPCKLNYIDRNWDNL